MKKGKLPLLGVVAIIVIILVSTAGFALVHVMAAKPPSPHIFASRQTSLQNNARIAAASANANATNASAAAPVLPYHGGPVMAGQANVYAIFWEPTTSTVSANYNSLIQRYFNDVGGSPLYQNLKQYTEQSDGKFPTNAVLAAPPWVDTGAYPANPMIDSDIQTEVTHAQTVNGWLSSSSNVFFVFTAKNEGLCTDSLQLLCTPDVTPNGLCAYHFNFGNTIYAAIPYAESPSFNGQCTPLGTGVSATSGPNSNDADMTINVTSHEQMEAATDPLGNAWVTPPDTNNKVYEMADKCAWMFGPNNPQGGDVTWNNNNYIVQQEWDNAINSCTLSGDHTIRDYSIKNLHSNLVMDVFNGGTNAGAQVIQWGNKNGPNQQWYLSPDGPFYQIVNRNSGLVLNVSGGAITNGANIIQWTNQHSLNEEWILLPDGANDEIVNVNSSLQTGNLMVMDVFNGGTNAGARVIQWPTHNSANEQWHFTPVVYRIVNRNSNLVMDVYKGGTNAGANVIQWANDNGANQKWSLVPDGTNNGTQVYQIVNLHSNLVMDVFNGGTTLGTNVIQWTNHNSPNQQWMLVPVGSYYQIVNVKSKLVLDVYKGGKTLGVDVIQWARTNGLNQQWSLIVTSP